MLPILGSTHSIQREYEMPVTRAVLSSVAQQHNLLSQGQSSGYQTNGQEVGLVNDVVVADKTAPGTLPNRSSTHEFTHHLSSLSQEQHQRCLPPTRPPALSSTAGGCPALASAKEELKECYGVRAHDAILNRFLGFSKEDWQRAITLLCYLRMFWNRPSIHYGQKRKQDFFRQYWASRETGEMLQKVENREKEERAKRRADFLTLYREVQSQSGVAGEIADSLLAFQEPVWILSSAERSRALYSAIARAARRDRTVLARDAQTVITEAVEVVADLRATSTRKEHIIDFLERAKDQTKLGRVLSKDIWVQFIYQVVSARDQYLRKTDKAQIEGQESDLAKAADKLYAAAGKHGNEWDWLALEVLASDDLMGESASGRDALDWE
ncbi:hypothetical protein B0T21DRAFT_352035 [Apiosordaria backusii]|uniref:Uncharacterized protein n=1 Tax=Apiosordaria backusii TaxID=314023 RepID=A0AA40AIS5_9PEZI|nr:hypothetical protein B0T21DRAFT_352035 [Apiosordaria backusii]